MSTRSVVSSLSSRPSLRPGPVRRQLADECPQDTLALACALTLALTLAFTLTLFRRACECGWRHLGTSQADRQLVARPLPRQASLLAQLSNLLASLIHVLLPAGLSQVLQLDLVKGGTSRRRTTSASCHHRGAKCLHSRDRVSSATCTCRQATSRRTFRSATSCQRRCGPNCPPQPNSEPLVVDARLHGLGPLPSFAHPHPHPSSSTTSSTLAFAFPVDPRPDAHQVLAALKKQTFAPGHPARPPPPTAQKPPAPAANMRPDTRPSPRPSQRGHAPVAPTPAASAAGTDGARVAPSPHGRHRGRAAALMAQGAVGFAPGIVLVCARPDRLQAGRVPHERHARPSDVCGVEGRARRRHGCSRLPRHGRGGCAAAHATWGLWKTREGRRDAGGQDAGGKDAGGKDAGGKERAHAARAGQPESVPCGQPIRLPNARRPKQAAAASAWVPACAAPPPERTACITHEPMA